MLIKKASFELKNLDEIKDENVINVEQHDMSTFLLNWEQDSNLLWSLNSSFHSSCCLLIKLSLRPPQSHSSVQVWKLQLLCFYPSQAMNCRFKTIDVIFHLIGDFFHKTGNVSIRSTFFWYKSNVAQWNSTFSPPSLKCFELWNWVHLYQDYYLVRIWLVFHSQNQDNSSYQFFISA